MFVKRGEPNDTGVQRFKKWFIFIPSYHCCYYHYYYTSIPSLRRIWKKWRRMNREDRNQNSRIPGSRLSTQSHIVDSSSLKASNFGSSELSAEGGPHFCVRGAPPPVFPDGECIHRHSPSKREHVTLMVTMQILCLGAGWVLQSVEWRFTKRAWWVYRVHRLVPIQLRLTPH